MVQRNMKLPYYVCHLNPWPFKNARTGNWWRDKNFSDLLTFEYKCYKICPFLMVQRNMKTGQESKIRRLQTKMDSMPIFLTLESEDEAIINQDFRKWTTKDIVKWLHQLQLGQYAQIFIDA